VALLLLFPLTASAASGIKTLNGIDVMDQFLSAPSGTNSMHMSVTSTGATHTFAWDGSQWAVGQGGTGPPSFPVNSILLGNGASAINSSSNFVYDPVTGFFGTGTSTQYYPSEKWQFVAETTDFFGANFALTDYNNSADSPSANYQTRTARGT